MKIYQVSKNVFNIEEIDIVRKTDSSYWIAEDESYFPLRSKWHESFEDINDAKKYLRRVILNKIDCAKRTVSHYEEILNKFEKEIWFKD